jgi:predicted DNA-binding transcriptional regulator AlpA
MQIEVITIPVDQLKSLVKTGVEEALLSYKEIHSSNTLNGEADIINRKAICEIFGVSLVTVHDWMTKGILPHYKMNGRTYFKKNEVLQAMKQVKIRRKG